MTGLRRTAVTATLALLVAGLGLAGSVRNGGAAHAQPSRLGASADRVTLRAQPLAVSAGTRVTVFGSIDPGRAGEDVKIQGKDCGRDYFRVVSGAITEEGGRWSTFYWVPGPSITLRAVWNNSASAEVTIRKRAIITIRKRTAKRYEVFVAGRAVWRKRAFVQRFDPRLGTWRPLKSVLLTESERYSAARGTFTLDVPKGTRVRAVFPRSQTGPCYLPGTSNLLRT